MSYIQKKDRLLLPLVKLVPPKITPNQLSITRLILALPIFLLLLNGYVVASLLLFAIAFLLDLIDGALARQRQQVSKLGKILDPMADKIVFFSVFLLLGAILLPFSLFATILVIEIVFIIASVVLPSIPLLKRENEVIVTPNTLGQNKMFLYAVGTIFLFLGLFHPLWYGLSVLSFAFGAILAVISLVVSLVSRKN